MAAAAPKCMHLRGQFEPAVNPSRVFWTGLYIWVPEQCLPQVFEGSAWEQGSRDQSARFHKLDA